MLTVVANPSSSTLTEERRSFEDAMTEPIVAAAAAAAAAAASTSMWRVVVGLRCGVIQSGSYVALRYNIHARSTDRALVVAFAASACLWVVDALRWAASFSGKG